MKGHVIGWLSAYHDGELLPHQAQAIMDHLAGCPHCRAALDRIRQLSRLAAAAPLPEGLKPPDRFAAEVVLRLPRRTPPAPSRLLRAANWGIPIGLAGAWGLVQALFLVTSLVQLLLPTGLAPGLNLLFPAQGPSLWAALPAAPASLPELLSLARQSLTLNDPLITQAVVYLFVQFVLAGLFGAWLAGWYVSRRNALNARAR